jgi:hypothetical protein
VLCGEKREPEGGQQSITGQIAAGTVSRHTDSGTTGCIEARDRHSIRSEHPGVLVDQQATLGVEERGPDADRGQIALQRSLPVLPAELVLRLTPGVRRGPGDGVFEPDRIDPDTFRQFGGPRSPSLGTCAS